MKCLFRLLIITAFFSISVFAQKQLEMEIVMQKDTFLEGEEVSFGFGVKNITKNILKLNVGTVNIKLLDESGKELKKTAAGILYDFVPLKKTLKNNEESYWVYDLAEMYGTQTYHSFFSFYFKTGTYRIKIKVKSPNNFIEKKTISFRVVEPKGDELKYFTSLKKIIAPIFKPNYKSELLVAQFENLRAAYPNSVYSPISLEFLICKLMWVGKRNSQKEKIISYLNEYPEKYTWSRKALGLIDNKVTNDKISKQEKIDYLKKLLPKSRKSPMTKMIQNYIREVTEK
jgi:hypothetical protein